MFLYQQNSFFYFPLAKAIKPSVNLDEVQF